MARHPFDPSYEQLPDSLAIFPLPGVLLLPGGILPLNVFEPRYLNMTLDALANHRMFGMIQPLAAAEPEALYEVGCAGRITAFQETNDGRLLLNLTGVARFAIGEELPMHRGYRRVRPDWSSYRADLGPHPDPAPDPKPLIALATRYFNAKSIEFDAERLGALSSPELANFLAMNLPFDSADKQALLEAASLEQRVRSLVAITEMSLLDPEPKTRH